MTLVDVSKCSGKPGPDLRGVTRGPGPHQIKSPRSTTMVACSVRSVDFICVAQNKNIKNNIFISSNYCSLNNNKLNSILLRFV